MRTDTLHKIISSHHNAKMQLPFTKMHGLGNDFVVLDGITTALVLDPDRVRKLCDRRRGVGADQLLLVEPPTEADADFRYRIFNADGAEVGQCGNGARCVAHYVQAKGWVQSGAPIRLQTEAQPMTLQIMPDRQVAVSMGVPDFTPAQVPMQTEAPGPMHQLALPSGEPLEFAAVSLGNPHAVIFTDSVARAAVDEIGAAFQKLSLFPERVNVGFCEVIDAEAIKLRVYERGVGETQACGSGACAAVAAGRWLRRLDASVKVSLKGGDLQISWTGKTDASLMMIGPAASVFEGCIEL